MSEPRTGPAPNRARTEEQLIDEMVEETLPASDATQLPGRTAADASNDGTPPERRSAPPRTIGNQGVVPSSRMVEETIPLADQGVVTLRFDGEHRRLHVYLGEDGLSLDAAAVDRLIAVLSEKRVQMD